MENSFIGYLTSAEAARRLRISKPTLRVLVSSGLIGCVPTPLGLLFDPLEIERARREGVNRRGRISA